jgi:hypothetical protein
VPDDIVSELVDAYEYHAERWGPIKAEGAKDMRYVQGDPWDEADKDLRGDDRPTVAPEEMSQYRNQVVNALMQNPRGAKFSPAGNGASSRGADFYQNKWREIEYRSHGAQQYVTVADNVLQRSYGFLRVKADYPTPRSANQDLWLEAFADPDMVLPDTDCQALDGRGSRFTCIEEWMHKDDFAKAHKGAKLPTAGLFGANSKRAQSWAQGSKIKRAEIWRENTTPRSLLLLDLLPLGAPAAPGSVLGLGGGQAQPATQLQAFEDEIPALQQKYRILGAKPIRLVQYPQIVQYFTNGLEILDEKKWPGLHIPIVPCYGKVLYVPSGGESKRVMLSMTRFGRDPWKSYCYACSQELEVLGMVPKAPLLAVEGQFANREQEVEELSYSPKAFLYYRAMTEATGTAILGPPIPLDYPVGQHLQALELVKEGFRRAIQAAMGSNFLPTQAQRINDKSGEALKKIDDVATQGTYHFVYAYDAMVRRAAIIGENLIDKYLGFSGETPVRTPDEKTQIVLINVDKEEAYDTDGEYGVTVSTGPSSDSVREAGEQFVETMTSNLAALAPIIGTPQCAALLAMLVRMRGAQLGPLADEIADIILPQQYKENDGKPPDPRLLALQGELAQVKQELQKAGFIIQTKQIEGQNKLQISREEAAATSFDKAADREVKLVVAELAAKVERMSLLLDERGRVGIQVHDAQEARLQRTHEAVEGHLDRLHASAEAGAQRGHEAGVAAGEAAVGQVQQERQHAHDDQQRAAGVRDQLQITAATPPAGNGNGAGA